MDIMTGKILLSIKVANMDNTCWSVRSCNIRGGEGIKLRGGGRGREIGQLQVIHCYSRAFQSQSRINLQPSDRRRSDSGEPTNAGLG